MGIRLRTILIIGAFIIQPFLSALLPAWFVPDLDFCILMVMAATMDLEDMTPSMVLIFALALIQDIYQSQFIGVTVLAMMIAMVVVIIMRRMANVENVVYIAVVVAVANFVYVASYWGIYSLLSYHYSFMYMIERFPQFLVPNAVVLLIAIFIVTRGIIQKRRDGYFR